MGQGGGTPGRPLCLCPAPQLRHGRIPLRQRESIEVPNGCCRSTATCAIVLHCQAQPSPILPRPSQPTRAPAAPVKFTHPPNAGGQPTHPPTHEWGIPSSKDEQVRAPGSTDRHTHSALMPPPPPTTTRPLLSGQNPAPPPRCVGSGTKMKCIKGAGNLRVILGIKTFFWPLTGKFLMWVGGWVGWWVGRLGLARAPNITPQGHQALTCTHSPRSPPYHKARVRGRQCRHCAALSLSIGLQISFPGPRHPFLPLPYPRAPSTAS